MRRSLMKITYCVTDEAPLLAEYSLLPIVRSFLLACGVTLETIDISLASRILAHFPEYLAERQRVPDTLGQLLQLSARHDANIVKLPGISASLPQLKAAIEELKVQGCALPDYPDMPISHTEESIRARYDQVRGGIVNTSLRQGNSERLIPDFVKAHARRAHVNGQWSPQSRSHVATMIEDDFRATEQALTLAEDSILRIEHVTDGGSVTALREMVCVRAGDVVDCAVMRRDALRRFLADEIASARSSGLLFSLQLKCTTMTVADPLIFGCAVRTYYASLFAAHGATLNRLGVEPINGFHGIQSALEVLPDRELFEHMVASIHREGPKLAMVDAARGVSTLHAPGGISIGAAMAAAIHASGKMPNAKGNRCDTKFVIPDHAYADLFKVVIEDCIGHGALDPVTMGSVTVIGLTADAAEEHGSQDTTFEIGAPGQVRIIDERGAILLQESVAAGDIWRMCRTTNGAIRDWTTRGLESARQHRAPAVFWLDETRPRDREILRKVRRSFAATDVSGLETVVMNVADSTRFTLERLRQGKNVVAVTGNMLRDYVTELFAVMEARTSTRVQATTRLPGGGALFETGAGGTAPEHVRQFLATNHLRWNSLGEAIALAASLELLARVVGNRPAHTLAQALKRASQCVLTDNRLPSRKVDELDTRGSHFHLAYYWAREMARDRDVGPLFAGLAEQLARDKAMIEAELLGVQGLPIKLGGYFRPDPARLSTVMRPSATFNEALGLLQRRERIRFG
jgi:isocitrate dehydrogenase